MNDPEQVAVLIEEGLDPDNPRVWTAIHLVRWDLELLGLR
ncbi:Uncharacterised protein [Mycobacteroides abscessus subsp. abscessus]|nr:Uncharacterised protein [Mycobacteroides abscessus subsp. abscessus]